MGTYIYELMGDIGVLQRVEATGLKEAVAKFGVGLEIEWTFYQMATITDDRTHRLREAS